MSVHHHPDDATLVSYAAGALPESFETLVACHLQFCTRCKQRIREAEDIGAALFEASEPVDASGRDDFFTQLMQEPDISPANTVVSEDSTGVMRQHAFPAPLKQLLEHGDIGLSWRRLVPGIQQIKMETRDGGLRLLRIQPGMSIPIHTHHGSEMTLILGGSYSDELGRFTSGDVADLDPTIEHQPMTDGSMPCICLVATDAPMKFQGFLPKLLQPFVGL